MSAQGLTLITTNLTKRETIHLLAILMEKVEMEDDEWRDNPSLCIHRTSPFNPWQIYSHSRSAMFERDKGGGMEEETIYHSDYEITRLKRKAEETLVSAPKRGCVPRTLETPSSNMFMDLDGW